MKLSSSNAVTPADALPLAPLSHLEQTSSLSYPGDFCPWGTQRAIAGVTLAPEDIADGFPL